MKIVKAKINGKTRYATEFVNGMYILEDGAIVRLSPNDVSGTRNVPEAVRECLKELLLIRKKIEKEKTKQYEFQLKVRQNLNELNDQYDAAIKQMNEKLGILSYADFAKAFYVNLPEKAKIEMEKKGFDIEEPTRIEYYGSGYLYISHNYMIDKYVRRKSFLFEEYDGTIQMYDDAEEDREYIRIRKQHSTVLDCCKAQPNEYLYMGDKDSLWYGCYYEFKLPELLTAEEAKKMAEKYFEK